MLEKSRSQRLGAPSETVQLERIARRLKCLEERLLSTSELKPLLTMINVDLPRVASDLNALADVAEHPSNKFAEAVAIADARRNRSGPLVGYLRSGRPTSARLLGVAADVLDGKIKRSRGQPKKNARETASKDLTPFQWAVVIAGQLERELRNPRGPFAGWGFKNRAPAPGGRLAPMHQEVARAVCAHIGRPELTGAVAARLRLGRANDPFKPALATVQFIRAWVDEVLELLRTSSF